MGSLSDADVKHIREMREAGKELSEVLELYEHQIGYDKNFRRLVAEAYYGARYTKKQSGFSDQDKGGLFGFGILGRFGILNKEEGNHPLSGQRRQDSVNKEISALITNRYFHSIPLDDIFSVLEKYGLIPLQEDYTQWSGFLTGETGHADIDVGYASSKREKDGITFYTPTRNNMLHLSWYTMPSGKYEVTAYLG